MKRFRERWNRISVTTKLTLLTAFAIFFLAVVIVSWSDIQARNTVISLQKESLKNRATSVSAQLDTQIANDLNRLRLLATNNVTFALFVPETTLATEQIKDSARYYYYLFLTQDFNIQSLNVLNLAGQIVFSTDSLDGKNFQEIEPEIENAVLKPIQKNPVPIASGAWFSKISQKPSYYYGAPVFRPNSKEIVGYVLMRLKSNLLREFARAENDRYGKGSFISILDKNNIAVADGRESLSESDSPEGYTYLFKGLEGSKYPANPLGRTTFPAAKPGTVDIIDYNVGDVNYFVAYALSSETGWEVRQYFPSSLINNPINGMTFTSLVGSLIFLIVALLVLSQLVTRLIQPFSNLQTPIQRLAQGDLSDRQVKISGSRETTDIAKAFELMAENLHGLVMQVRNSTQVVVSAALQVAKASEKQLINANMQDYYSQQVISAMRNMLQNSEQILDVARQVSVSASLTFDLADKLSNLDQRALTEVTATRDLVETGLDKITALSSDVEIISQHTVTLQETTGEIGNVLYLLRSIANEVHLLSLNAAIEAAGAGAYGDRFSVIAGQIRQLAARSQDAVVRVQEMINNIQSVTEQVVGSVDEGHQKAHLVLEDVGQISESMNRMFDVVQLLNEESLELVKAANASAEAADKISTTAMQQTLTSNEVFDMMKDTQELISELVKNEQQALTVSTELSHQSADLLNNMSKFKL